MHRLRLDERELLSRRNFYEVTQDDLERLAALRPLAERHSVQVVDSLYDLILNHPESRVFFPDDDTVRRVKRLQREYFIGPVSYTHLRAHETGRNLVCRLLLEKKKK